MISFEEFARERPKFHTWDGGRTYNSGGLDNETLEEFYNVLRSFGLSQPKVIETGAGGSTISFLMAGCLLISVAPEQSLWDRIEEYCVRHAISLSGLEKHVECSEFALPAIASSHIAEDKWVDFGLIDGAHEYPSVFVDFCYINVMLRKGGVIVVDDLQLHSPKELARFILGSSDYELYKNLGKTVLFRKTTDRNLMGNFGSNRYLVNMTNRYQKERNPHSLDVG